MTWEALCVFLEEKCARNKRFFIEGDLSIFGFPNFLLLNYIIFTKKYMCKNVFSASSPYKSKPGIAWPSFRGWIPEIHLNPNPPFCKNHNTILTWPTPRDPILHSLHLLVDPCLQDLRPNQQHSSTSGLKETLYLHSGQIIIFQQPRFPWNRRFPSLNHHLEWGRVRSL